MVPALSDGNSLNCDSSAVLLLDLQVSIKNNLVSTTAFLKPAGILTMCESIFLRRNVGIFTEWAALGSCFHSDGSEGCVAQTDGAQFPLVVSSSTSWEDQLQEQVTVHLDGKRKWS